MSDGSEHPKTGGRRVLGALLVAGGVAVLAGLGVFVSIALGFRRSFTASLPPIEDLIEAFVLLSPAVLLALLLIGYGRRLLRKD